MTAREYEVFIAMMRLMMVMQGVDMETIGGALYPYRLHLAQLRERERRAT